MSPRIYLASKFIIPTAVKDIILVKKFFDKIKKSHHFPLTLIKAGPGYGKSTSIGFYFKNFSKKYFWFNLTRDDNELFNFISNLVYSVKMNCDSFGVDILTLLEETESLRDNWVHITNMYINGLWKIREETNEDIYLVLEDLHRVLEQPDIFEIIIYLINNIPPGIHLVMTSRYLPTNFPWQQWKLRGKVLILSEEDLAFGEEEVRTFFNIRNGVSLDQKVVDLIMEKTEGWPIALEMLKESFDLEKIMYLDNDISENSQSLFAFLAIDVLDKQEKTIRDFLLNCSVLNYLNHEICEYLIGRDGPQLMNQVVKKELFIHDYGKSNYRFHSLFKKFLQHVAIQEGYPVKELHSRATRYYLDREYYEEAIDHLIKAGEYSQAVKLIIQVSPELIKGARFNTLLYWLKQIPEEIFMLNPWLYLILGDIHRLTSEFYLALNLYEKAENLKPQDHLFLSEVLQRKALVYLDTVQPSPAEPLLNRALNLKERLPEREKSHLLNQIAENNLNCGRISEVLKTQKKAQKWGLELPAILQVRLMLRTGRLQDAAAYLEKHLSSEGPIAGLSPSAHRENKLVLSLVLSLMGKDFYKVYSLAREGIEMGQRVGSPFTECVAAARMGHSYQIRQNLDKAIEWYLRAGQIADQVRVPRGKGEPLWGLCLAYGYRGQWELAFRYGEEGRKICLEASDYWLVALISLAMGIGCLITENYNVAMQYLLEGRSLAEQCQDPFLYTVSLLWESLLYWKLKDKNRIRPSIEQLFKYINENSYGFLINSTTIWSPRDRSEIKAMLWYYQEICGPANPLKDNIKIYLKGSNSSYHPGYSLGFKTLGDFKVWRGAEEIKSEDWSRDKARKLLQILISHRGQFVRSEQLVDLLWPEKSRERGKQNLKVIINTLNRILEPNRNGNNPFFLERNLQGYGLINKENLRVDADKFSEQVHTGLSYYRKNNFLLAQEALEEAVDIYKGDYLPDIVYEEWVIAEREAMQKLYLNAAEKLAEIYLNYKQWDKCLDLCESILNKDCCWENAYRIMIMCYCEMKEKILAVQTFQRCKENLSKHLSVKPSQKLLVLLKEGIAGL